LIRCGCHRIVLKPDTLNPRRLNHARGAIFCGSLIHERNFNRTAIRFSKR
jgi:hypothetical protein